MKAVEQDQDDNKLIGLSEAPEVLVEGYRGVMMRAGMLKLNFFAQRFDPETDQVEKYAAVTLTIPLADFSDIVRGLETVLRDMQENGTLPKAATL